MAEQTHTQDLNEAEQQLLDMVSKVLQGESSLGTELNFSDEEIDAMYLVAYNLYQSRKYADALKLFGLLSTLVPLEYRFLFGGASCMQMLGEYLTASMYFQLACGLEQDNPAPMLHSAECFLALKDKDGAKIALENVLERAGDKAEYQAFKQRAEVMLGNLTA